MNINLTTGSTFLVVGTLAATVLIGLSACVSQSSYDALKQDRDALAKENESLQKQTRALSGNVKLARNMEAERSEELQTTKEAVSIAKALYDSLVIGLSSELDAQKVKVEQMQSGVNVDLSQDVLFNSGSAQVNDSGREVLLKVAKQLKDVPYQTIVGGFTDNVPISKSLAAQFPSNWDLAAARATEVLRVLEESGVPSDRLVAVSFGETRPVASNDTPEGREQNRRIEIRLRPVMIE